MAYTNQKLKEQNNRPHNLPKLWQLTKRQMEMCTLSVLKINFESGLEKAAWFDIG